MHAEMSTGAPLENAAPALDENRLTIEGRTYLTRAGLARTLGVSVRTLTRWETARIHPPRVKIANLVLYPEAEIPGWLDTHTVRTPARRGRA
ncbi:helix-turn-helix domain-containing protein [Pararhodospirillum oryzae]|uniref:Uncharacterized protein n=1 Tax=Pararhodospirillum oryzae TaxID=478448 RepID=A0A512H685_9PROT|nr:hypothetical protein [Pararhodospirillum oryzae]GEO80957.1 hypothetical protein ROR02_10880 [Pararhodospirillum oryzae]